MVTGIRHFLTVRLFQVKFDLCLLKWISDPPLWAKSRKMVLLGNLETVKLYIPCCIYYGTVVTDSLQAPYMIIWCM